MANRNLPRGIRNNNPGNIVRTKPRTKWQGRVADDDLTDARFEQFENMPYGVRATARTLISYQDRHNINTVAGIIARWAPPNGVDQNGIGYSQNTESYIREVCRAMNVASDDIINVHKWEVMRPLCAAIFKHENGGNFVSEADLDRGLLLAGISPPDAVERPLAATKTGAGVAIAAGATALGEVGQEPLAEATSVLQSLVPIMPSVGTILVILVFAGLGLSWYGRFAVRKRTGV